MQNNKNIKGDVILSPIAIATYSRLDHLTKTINALRRNTLAAKSELYIFSDGPKKGDEEIVSKLRKYLYTIDGFKKVHIIERNTNNLIDNICNGVNQLLIKYEKFIFLEDDIVTAPGFLQFMNDGLETYKDNKNIFSICSYTPNINIDLNNSDNFLMQRLSCWGFAIWKDRYEQIQPIEENNYLNFLNDKEKILRTEKYMGSDLLNWFKTEINGSLDGWDSKASFLCIEKNYYCVYPRKSLSLNIGHDGSGLHNGVSDKFNVELWQKEVNFELPKIISEDKNITSKIASFYSSKDRNISQIVIENIINKIIKANITSVSIWGTGDLAELIFLRLNQLDINVNYFIDTWAKDNDIFLDKPVVKPLDAIARDEKNIIICSIGNRNKMMKTIAQYNINVFYYED